MHIIVGIGASAGGVEAVTTVLQNLTPDSGLAYALVQHLAPTHESFLVDLLRNSSRIPVVQAEEQMPVKQNRLHVIPPNVQMTITDGHLHLAPRPSDRTQYTPIDSFFQSLAAQAGHRAVGVVLSGSASDGAAGLRAINGAGGFTMAQDPRTARYDGMPRAAIATGAVDLVLPPEGIAAELGRLGSHPFLAAADETRPAELSIPEPQLERLFYLQSIIQDLEAANEELQSANEEILSSNEELQSTNEELDTAKEELQSTNEELNTVNEELNTRNEELSRVNADLINPLAAVPAAIVIVTSDLRIRRFTPLAEEVLNLIPADIGRPLGDIRPNLDVPDLEDLARDVIDSVTARELAVRDRTGRPYLLRIRPYKDQENRIDGAVLAFTDGPAKVEA